MKKTRTFTVVPAFAVVLCVCLASPLYSAPPDWANSGKPMWEITGASWIEHPSNPRFAIYNLGTMVESDDVVLDKETRLVWTRMAGTTSRNWYEATYDCYGKYAGGRMGWRLPANEELLSLAVRPDGGTGITLPTGHPFTLSSEGQPSYWTSTTIAEYPNAAYTLCFSTAGCLVEAVKETGSNYVWCVRGGSGHDGY